MSNKRLGAYILDQRRTRNMTQQEVAERLGVHQTRVSHWERGSRMPNHEQLQALAGLFNVDVQTLVAQFVVDNEVERALVQDPALRLEDREALLTIYRSLAQRA